MNQREIIQITEIARRLGKHKAAIFKVIKKLKISPIKLAGDDSRGQLASYVSADDERAIAEYINERKKNSGAENADNGEVSPNDEQMGYFYLIQLEPSHDPLRFKVGFAINVNDRLRKHRCSAPFAVVVKSWSCKLMWEKTAIDCVTIGCEKLHTEVFRSPSNIEAIIERGSAFFSLFSNYTKISINMD